MGASVEEAFAPYGAWASILLPHAMGDDASHDASHLARVWGNAKAIVASEGGDSELLAVACLLHDCVAIEKNSPLRPMASRLAAAKAAEVMSAHWPRERVLELVHAIEAHSFSARIEPRTHEAKVLQDADRLDSLGAIGVARMFHVSGRIGRALYDPADPRAEGRPLDDLAWSIDHFRTKLLHLAEGFRTGAGAGMARVRHERLERFLADFEDEIGLDPVPAPTPSPFG